MSKEALELIAACTKIAYEAISLAEDIADRNDLEFEFNISYGMGGSYYSPGYVEKEGLRWSEPGWNSSSQSC